MWSVWQSWSLIWCACTCVVLSQRVDQGAMLSPRPARVRDRDLTKQDEPTCDQLKAMWRFSKRQARAPEIMNEMSSYRDPLMYNEWPVYAALPRAAPRFKYYPVMPREAYGRIVTKAPPNVVRQPDYDEMFGMLNIPHASGKILRYAGPSRGRGTTAFMAPPQRNRFETLKKMIQEEHARDIQRKYETEQKQELKSLAAGRNTDEYAYGSYNEEEGRGLQTLQEPRMQQVPYDGYNMDGKKPLTRTSQISSYSRNPPDRISPSRYRRTYYHPYFDISGPEILPYGF